ncbi:MAG: hypothetical protein NXH82_10775, partial [Rhodobacteraceae bacterium]|nr:hypothetical protein [Paracoccaceae bacterium]
MAQNASILTFRTEDRSLWGPGAGLDLSLDTGRDLIFSASDASDFGFDLAGNGFEAEAWANLELGLRAFANFGRTGSFDASLSILSRANLPGGILIGSDADAPGRFTVDLSDVTVLGSELSTQGFSPGGSAGLNLHLKFAAGLRNGEYYHWFGSGEIDNIAFLDIDFTGDNEIPLISVASTAGTSTLDLGDAVQIAARLPEGADTQATAAHDAGAPATVTARGQSDTQFLSASVDLDALFVQFGSLLPVVGAKIKALGETVFAEHRFDLNDYVSYVPEGKLVLGATMLDISVSSGIAITEENTLTFGAGGQPVLRVDLTSDNGTPGNENDDQRLLNRALDDPDLTFDRPVWGDGIVPEYGTIRITADFRLQGARFDHKLGLGVSTKFNISALQAELTGAWVPSALKTVFGPVLSLDLPDANGFTADLFSIPLPGYDLGAGDFDPVRETYEVFFTNALAPSQTSEAELEQATARQAVIDYKEARQANLNATFDTLAALIEGDPAAYARENIQPGDNAHLLAVAGPLFVNWSADVDAALTRTKGPADIYAVNPLSGDDPYSSLPDGYLMAAVTDGSPPGRDIYDAAGLNLDTVFSNGDLRILEALGGDAAGAVHYRWQHYDPTAGGPFGFSSTAPLEVLGGPGDDLLVYFYNTLPGAADQRPARYFDGSGGADRFVANFARVFPNDPVSWDLREVGANPDQDGVTLALGGETVTVRGIESLTLATGSGDDTIVGGGLSDRLFTGDGDDFVILPEGQTGDTLDLGAGDDYGRVEIGVRYDGDGRPAATSITRVAGGTGHDHVELVAHSSPSTEIWANRMGLKLALLETRADLGRSVYVDIFSPAYLQLALLDRYLGSPAFFGDAVPEERSGAAGSAEEDTAVLYAQGLANSVSALAEKVLVNVSVEDLSLIGSDTAGDLLLYTGGSRYAGGSDGADLLVADFRAGASDAGAQNGLRAWATGDRFVFGSSAFDGIDRFTLRGTDAGDRIEGGALADYIHGGAGNDTLAGDDLSIYSDAAYLHVDTVIGGAGSDLVAWHDQGPDRMSGGELDAVADGPGDLDVLEIGGLTYAPFSLSWGFLAANNGTQGIAGTRAERRYVEGSGLFTPFTPVADLVRALDLSTDNQGYVGVAYNRAASIEDLAVFNGFEQVNAEGDSFTDDLLIYLGGTRYDGGHGSGLVPDDRDIFLADFSDQFQAIDLRISDPARNGTEIRLQNGVTLNAIEQLVVRAGRGDDVIHGGDHADWIDGGAGADRLWGAAGDDTVLGGAGDDVVLWSADGNVSAEGGTGIDRLIVSGTGADGQARGLGVVRPATGPEGAHGLQGSPTSAMILEYLAPDALPATQITAIATSDDLAAPGFTGHSLRFSEFELVDVIGSDGVGDVVAYAGGELYRGGDGAGRDLFLADLTGEDRDFFFDSGYTAPPAATSGATAFADTFDIGNGTFIGGFESFGLRLGAGRDTVFGGALGDVIHAGAGDDLLATGGSDPFGGTVLADLFHGEDGDDALTWQGGRAFFDGGEGRGDLAIWDATDAPLALWLGGGPGLEGAAPWTAEALDDHAALGDLAAAAQAWNATRQGGWLSFGDLSLRDVEQISGHGSDAADVVMAATGQAQFFTGAGDDVLVSGARDDLLVGGTGRDRYVFAGGFGTDLIAGETDGGAELHFVGRTFADLQFTWQGRDLVVSADGANAVRLADLSDAGLEALRIHTSDAPAGLSVPLDPPDLARAPGALVSGTVRDDTDLTGGAGNDTVLGRAGDDQILGGAGADLMDGGAGYDVVSYAARDTGISVDLGAWRGTGGAAAGDVFAGIEGVVAGLRGATLFGDAQGNFLVGSPERDRIEGRGGQDLLIGQEGDDEIFGGAAADVIFGDAGADALQGDDGDDDISGGAGRDTLKGSDGNDTLRGGADDDTLRGDSGDDILVYAGLNPAGGVPGASGLDSLDGGADRDMADFAPFHAGVHIDLAQGRAVSDFSQRAPRDPTTATLLATLSQIEDARGGAFDDMIVSAGPGYFDGGGGDDTLRATASGGNRFVGGAGRDLVDYSALVDAALDLVLNGAEGAETIVDLPAGRDILHGIEGVTATARADRVLADLGPNVLLGGAGDDHLDAGRGDDLIAGGAGDDTVYGGDGVDIFSAEDGVAAVDIDMALARYQDGHQGRDLVSGFEGLRGTAFDDRLTGDEGANILMGGAGNDRLVGGGNADMLMGEDGADTLMAGAPQAVLRKAQSATDPVALDTWLTLAPRAGADRAQTVPTATVHGTASGVGDVFTLDVAAGDAIVIDFLAGDARLADAAIVLHDGSGQFVARIDLAASPDGGAGGGTYRVAPENAGRLTLTLEGGAAAEPIAAGLPYKLHVGLQGGTPVALPLAGAVLMGGDGDDDLIGNRGADTLFGDAGGDTLDGGAGGDLLAGGDGDDFLYGDGIKVALVADVPGQVY